MLTEISSGCSHSNTGSSFSGFIACAGQGNTVTGLKNEFIAISSSSSVINELSDSVSTISVLYSS